MVFNQNRILKFHLQTKIDITFLQKIFREGRGNAHLTGDYKRISDVVVRNFDAVTTEYYLKYVEAHPIILDRLEQTILKDSRFAQVVRDFESQKVCYLPLTTLIVKPLHRILHYDLLLERK